MYFQLPAGACLQSVTMAVTSIDQQFFGKKQLLRYVLLCALKVVFGLLFGILLIT